MWAAILVMAFAWRFLSLEKQYDVPPSSCFPRGTLQFFKVCSAWWSLGQNNNENTGHLELGSVKAPFPNTGDADTVLSSHLALAMEMSSLGIHLTPLTLDLVMKLTFSNEKVCWGKQLPVQNGGFQRLQFMYAICLRDLSLYCTDSSSPGTQAQARMVCRLGVFQGMRVLVTWPGVEPKSPAFAKWILNGTPGEFPAPFWMSGFHNKSSW